MKILKLNVNTKGKDYVVGDIHGYFSHLEVLLDKVEFNPEVDRLICCGDLVDRGPKSHEVVDWLNKPWFFSVMGNHDAYYAYFYESKLKSLPFWFKEKQRGWFFELPNDFKVNISRKLMNLPLVISIGEGSDGYGIVHGGIPEGISWDKLIEKINNKNILSCRSFMWNRKVARKIASGNEVSPVIGIKRVFSGHTVCKDNLPIHSGNRTYIDTGAGYLGENTSAKMTICEIQNINNFQQI